MLSICKPGATALRFVSVLLLFGYIYIYIFTCVVCFSLCLVCIMALLCLRSLMLPHRSEEGFSISRHYKDKKRLFLVRATFQFYILKKLFISMIGRPSVFSYSFRPLHKLLLLFRMSFSTWNICTYIQWSASLHHPLWSLCQSHLIPYSPLFTQHFRTILGIASLLSFCTLGCLLY